MIITKIRIDGQLFFLDPAQDVQVLRERIQDAARTEPTFVDFDTVGHGMVGVLISAGLPVRFEQVERTQDEFDDMQENPPSVDIDPLWLDGPL